MKAFADDNFKFDENGRKLSKWVENTVGKGEIAHYSVFKRLVSQGHQKKSLHGNGLTISKVCQSEVVLIASASKYKKYLI